MILLTCDHPRRELLTLIELQKKIIKKGINCKIINKGLILQAYNLYKPEIITIPHSLNNFHKIINILNKKVNLIVIPSESCGFVDKFIEMQYCNIFTGFKKSSNHQKIDYFFTQSDYTSKYLKRKKLIKKNLISTGFLYFDYWYTKKKKSIKKKKIGIALTNEMFIRFFNNKNFILNYKNSNEQSNYLNNYWRLNQFNLDLYYYSLVFELIKKIPSNYEISFRAHPLDAQSDWEKVFKNQKNLKIESKKRTSDWVNEQDLIVSSFSGISMDSYIFNKPHISLVNMIPKEIIDFKAYDSHFYKEIGDKYSLKPNNFKSLMRLIKAAKFKKNIKYDKDLKKYYDYPSKVKPIERVFDNLIKIYEENQTKFIHIDYSKNQNIVERFVGNFFGAILLYRISEIKLYFNRYNHENYYPKITRFIMKIPYKIYGFFLNN